MLCARARWIIRAAHQVRDHRINQQWIADHLNDHGYLTPRGLAWTQPLVSVLIRGRYQGLGDAA